MRNFSRLPTRTKVVGGLLVVLALLILIGTIVFATVLGTQQGNQSNGANPTVQPGLAGNITVDFGSRQNHNHPISSNLFGIGGLGFNDTMAGPLHQAGFKVVRIGRDLETIFPTAASATDPAQQNWTKFDELMTILANQGFQPLITLSYTPPWLQPQNQTPPLPNPCLTNSQKVPSSHIKPTFIVNGVDEGPTKWGEIAAQVVAHIDQKFPTVKPLYEIWNEPNGTKYLCVADNDPNAKQIRLTQYKAIYAAAGPLMRQQAARDHVSIEIGGPALANIKVFATTWIPALVNDPTIAPYLDFISYHHYIGTKDKDMVTGGLAAVQDISTGAASEYEYIASVVRAGRQPNARSTPIYIDEYNAGNDSSSGDVGSFRNSQKYGALWNTLFVADLLNTVIDTRSSHGAAQSLPTDLTYFTASNPPPGEFCMFGDYDGSMDCSYSANSKPYPAYYAYLLLGGSNYLDITNGGYVANSVSGSGQLVVSGFYTKAKDDILIVNPTGQNYSPTVLAQNPGSVKDTASLYILNEANLQISTQQITLSSGSNGYSVTVSVPAYSTVAIALS